ncbi:hypothetical protein [Streptomyces lavendulocolor]|uniref:hypothetical protein n=1 Tax=Streptomyces lavendulocolor TaxID=67316 RepID=UPI0033D38482
MTGKLIEAVLVQDFVDCRHGSASGPHAQQLPRRDPGSIGRIGVGDLVQATDPDSGKLPARKAVDTFRHDTQRPVDLPSTATAR